MQLTFFVEERHASPSPSPVSEKEWQTLVETWPSSIWHCLTALLPSGAFGRTSPVFCHRTEEGILAPSSEGWQNSGMGSPTEFLTLNTSEWNHTPEPFHNAVGVSSLSDIVETGAVLPQYYLSRKACQGILRRAERRGKAIPATLLQALLAVAEGRATLAIHGVKIL